MIAAIEFPMKNRRMQCIDRDSISLKK